MCFLIIFLPTGPGRGLFAVSEHHLIVVGDVALNKMESTDGHGLRNQVGTEIVAAVKGHEEAERPEEVGLVMLLRLLSNQTFL